MKHPKLRRRDLCLRGSWSPTPRDIRQAFGVSETKPDSELTLREGVLKPNSDSTCLDARHKGLKPPISTGLLSPVRVVKHSKPRKGSLRLRGSWSPTPRDVRQAFGVRDINQPSTPVSIAIEVVCKSNVIPTAVDGKRVVFQLSDGLEKGRQPTRPELCETPKVQPDLSVVYSPWNAVLSRAKRKPSLGSIGIRGAAVYSSPKANMERAKEYGRAVSGGREGVEGSRRRV